LRTIGQYAIMNSHIPAKLLPA